MRACVQLCAAVLVSISLAPHVWAQGFNGAIVGVVRDPSGGVLPGATVTIRNVATDQVVTTTVTGAEGEYAVRNLAPARYAVEATLEGFRPVTNARVDVTIGTTVRVEIELPVGTQQEVIEVTAGGSVLAQTATQEHGITPETLQQLPLLMNSGPRAAATFAILMPGVSTGGGANAFDARINGGLQSGDEATLDGVSMQQGFMSQGGMVSIFQDFPMSPDMVSEVKVLTSNYAPEHGSTTGGQIMAVTKSGGSTFRGAAFEYHRSDALKARQWGTSEKPEFTRNNYGAAIGGPAKAPGLWQDRWKSYFYFVHEGYRQTGGSSQPLLSIPSAAQRTGDFRDWRDAAGNLIPIYDPATLRPDGQGGWIKDQFMGCDGNTPNVICPSRIHPIVRPWLDSLPTPSASGPLNNFLAPAIPDTILGNSDYYMGRFDVQVGARDHLFVSFWHQRAPAKFVSTLPQAIANETYSDPQNSWVNRFNYDRIVTPNLLNHLGMGYLNRNEGYGCVNQDFVGQFPQIPGVAGYNVPPQVSFSDGYATFGCTAGVNVGNITTRPTFIINDILTWTRSAHTVKVGMEYRSIAGNIHANGNQAGSFNFGRGPTGLLGVNSGSPIASFLLGAVSSGNATFRAVDSWYPRQSAWVLHAGDTWRVNNKLTLDYGLRWDYYSPSREKYNRFSFFDPTGANSGAAGRPGRLAFAGTEWGAASYGREYPEEDWYGGFAPRVGAVYAVNNRTVVRAGWGIFYHQAFYPGWGGGISLDGFSNTPSFSSTLGGIQPAFFLDQGLPQNFERPPDIRDDYRNGQGILYRPLDANERPYAHQWNITVDRELAQDLGLSVGYVGSAGRRLPSSLAPLNAIDPAHLSLGDRLNDEFQPGQASLHGVPLPYAGWVEQMTGCAPSVAQALRPYPQYCDNLQGLNENYGTSLYNSLQLKLEKRFSEGTYALVSYTLSRTLQSSSENTQRDALTWNGVDGVISPFEQERNYTVASSDTPHVLSAAFVYELPFGRGKRFLNEGGVANAIVGGWQMSTIYRYSSGLPLYFRSGFCNVPGQFRAGCIPAITNLGAVFAQEKGSFDPARGPLFNKDAFEQVSAFNYYYGMGSRVEEDVRGFAYKNQDLSFIKNTRLTGNTNVQLRFEIFNLWNWHMFTSPGQVASGFSRKLRRSSAAPNVETPGPGDAVPRTPSRHCSRGLFCPGAPAGRPAHFDWRRRAAPLRRGRLAARGTSGASLHFSSGGRCPPDPSRRRSEWPSSSAHRCKRAPGRPAAARKGRRGLRATVYPMDRPLPRMILLLLALWLCAPGLAAQDLPPPLAERFAEGVRALRESRPDDAEAAFRAILAAGGSRAFVHHNLGVALQQRGRHADAVPEFRAALKLDPKMGPARLLAGASLLALGRPQEAAGELERAVELLPAEPLARVQLADAYERTGNVAGIVDQYRQLATLAPRNGEYAYRLGKAYVRLAQWSFERIRAIEPGSARLPQALGREYLQQGRPDLAAAAFEEAVRRDPALPGVQLALARIHLDGGRLQEAARAIERELGLSPDDSEARQMKAAIDAALAGR